ncbi:MAG: hypothetical protein QM762_13630 [Chryseolinea sp.]
MAVFVGLTAFGQECRKLEDGQYSFKHKTKAYKKADFTLTIAGDFYFITKDGHEYPNGRIEWWTDNCMFRLNADEGQRIEERIGTRSEPQDTDSIKIRPLPDPISVLEKTNLSCGEYCYEIVNRRTFRLTYCGNLHITSAEGRIGKK